MQFIKIPLLALFCTIQLNSTPREVIIPISANSTVADLFTYVGADGKKHISFPPSPHFKSYWSNEYSAFYKKGLTLQSFLQFIRQGHMLFDDPQEEDAFYSATRAIIPLLKISDFKPINNLSPLHKTQEKIMDNDETQEQIMDNEQIIIALLESLKLSDDEIREKLTSILSSRSSYTVSRFLESFFQPFRSKLSNGKITVRSGFIYPILFLIIVSLTILIDSHRKTIWKQLDTRLPQLYQRFGARFNGSSYEIYVNLLKGCLLIWFYLILTTIAAGITAIMSPESLHFYSPEPDGGIEVFFDLLPDQK